MDDDQGGNGLKGSVLNKATNGRSSIAVADRRKRKEESKEMAQGR